MTQNKSRSQIRYEERTKRIFFEKKVFEEGEWMNKKFMVRKTFLDFYISTFWPKSKDITEHEYTAHINTIGENPPEIRILDPNGSAKYPGERVSLSCKDFLENNKWLQGKEKAIVDHVKHFFKDRLKAATIRWKQRKEEKKAKKEAERKKARGEV